MSACAKRACSLLLVSLLLCCPGHGGTLPGAPNCPLFPANNVWNADISGLPVDPNSANYIANMSPGTGLHPDFGSFAGYGIPYNVVSSAQPKLNVDFSQGYPTESDNGPYPVPPNPNIEGNDLAACSSPAGNGDCHVLIVDKDACILYELGAAATQGPGLWKANAGAIWSLNSNALRTDSWTSADAAGLPILPGLVRYDEVVAGTINHAFRFTMVNTKKAYIYPARHYASSNTGAFVPPMGLRVRLKATANLSGLGPQALAIAHAMQKYGLILADNGSNWYISGASDPNFDDNDLGTMKTRLHGSDFEVVDTNGLRNGPDSATRVVNVGPGGTHTFVDTVSGNSTTGIPVNTTVVWNWITGSHSTTSGTCYGGCTPDNKWDSGQLGTPNTFMQVFNQVGTYPYFCSVHNAMMQGTVIVTPPWDYTLAIPDSPQTVFASQAATFHGTLTAVNGYNSPVNLSCGSGHPATCTPAPASPTPTAPFTVAASDAISKDYTFNIQGVGTDPVQIAHAQSVTLRVVDFALGPPSPASVTMTDGNTSAPVVFSLNPMGSFNYPVTLNCAGLPPNTSCAFNNQPAPVTVTPSGGPLSVNMTITSSGATPGTYPGITITAASNPARPGGSPPQPFSLTISAPSGSTDLSVADGAPEAPLKAHEPGQLLTFTFAVQNNGGSAANTQVSVTLSNASLIKSANFTHGGPVTPCPFSNNVATCSLGTMANPDSASLVVTVVPKFARSLMVTAVVNSSASDTNLTNNLATVVRQIRPKPLARRGLVPRVP